MTIAFVLGLEAALVLLLENRSPAVPRKLPATPIVRLNENASLARLAVNDPTLYVFPHHEGFSGEAWLNRTPSFPFHSPRWTETNRWWQLSPATLGTRLKDFIAANASPRFDPIATIEPAKSVPALFPMETAPATSALRVEGALEKRRLLAPTDLRSWPRAEVIAPSRVHVLVDAEGHVRSAVLLPSDNSREEAIRYGPADQRALELAKDARFESIAPTGPGSEKNPANDLTFGVMIFDWQTAPPRENGTPGETQ